MKPGHITAMFALLLPLAGALWGCGEPGEMRIENYTTEDPEYHRNHSHYRQLDRTISDFGAH